MCRSLVILFFIVTLHFSMGYKWISLKPDDPFPENPVILSQRGPTTYVGRAMHFNEVLPAEVWEDRTASIYSCSKEVTKHNFEILVATENCHWKKFINFDEVPENIVKAGHDEINEPIYFGRVIQNPNHYYYDSEKPRKSASFFLTSQEVISSQSTNGAELLVCDDLSKWEDTYAAILPKNSISGGVSSDNNEIFVARLKSGCRIIPGQAIPKQGIATNELQDLKENYCQVLVGDSDEYKWVSAANGFIPDNAIASGKMDRELMYVARMNQTLGYLTYSMAKISDDSYEILVRN